MTEVYRKLGDRIRSELNTLGAVVEKVQRAWDAARERTADQDLLLDAVALNLHSFYSGLESVLLLIARHADTKLPRGETWHRDLLWQMVADMPEARPAVISARTARGLDAFRRFRHVVRNIYATSLLPDRIETLVGELPEVWQGTFAELDAFARFLDDLAEATKE